MPPLPSTSFHWPDRSCLPYLLHISAENPINDQVCPEERPLALNVLKQLKLSRFIVEAIGVLQGGHDSKGGNGWQDPLKLTGLLLSPRPQP